MISGNTPKKDADSNPAPPRQEQVDVELQPDNKSNQGGRESRLRAALDTLKFHLKNDTSPWSLWSIPRKIIAVAFGLLFVWCVIPIFFGIHGIGVVSSSLIMLCISAAACCWDVIEKAQTKRVRAAIIAVELVGAAGLIAFGLVSGLMLKASMAKAPESGNYTLVVLGCKTVGEDPSWMLTDRLDKACEILSENPDINCVVTGGQGDDEHYTEAWVMKKYLTEKGIDEDRIFMEESAESTEDNLLYSKAVIELNGLSENIVIVTDRFHELRAQIWAKKAGFENIYSECCETRPYLVIGYWFREMFGLARLYVFGS